jgi:hypothetical protein
VPEPLLGVAESRAPALGRQGCEGEVGEGQRALVGEEGWERWGRRGAC